MNTPHVLHLPYREPDPALRGHQPAATDYRTFISETTVIVNAETEQVAIVYVAPIPDDTRMLLEVLRRTDIPLTDRMNGMVSRSKIFGYRPRNPVRNPQCARAAWEKGPDHDEVCAFAAVVARYYQHYAPSAYAAHMRKARRVLPAWRMGSTPFTSGIVNQDAALIYHTDRNNFADVWSGMVAFKRGVVGGYLSIPGYDVGIEIADRSLLLFEAQATLHGVTPMQVQPDGWRYTLVFYTREHMGACLPPAFEATHGRRRRAPAGGA